MHPEARESVSALPRRKIAGALHAAPDPDLGPGPLASNALLKGLDLLRAWRTVAGPARLDQEDIPVALVASGGVEDGDVEIGAGRESLEPPDGDGTHPAKLLNRANMDRINSRHAGERSPHTDRASMENTLGKEGAPGRFGPLPGASGTASLSGRTRRWPTPPVPPRGFAAGRSMFHERSLWASGSRSQRRTSRASRYEGARSLGGTFHTLPDRGATGQSLPSRRRPR